MNEEELFSKLFPEYVVNGKPLSPYFDLFESGYEQSEKRIEELEAQIERLKGDLELWEGGACRATNLDKCGVVKELKAQIEKIKRYLDCEYCEHYTQPCGCKNCNEETRSDWKLKEIKEK